MFNFSWQAIAARVLVLFFILPFHECAHAFVAYKLGDSMARNQGRMTLNPLKHLDWYGALLLLVCGFGWANPVPINARNFKNPKYGMAISALAGPVANLVLSFLMLALCRVMMLIPIASEAMFTVLQALYAVFWQIAWISITLAVFNLLPVPPLDGSRIVLLFLPERVYFHLMRYERYIFLAVMALVLTGVLDTPISWLSTQIYRGMCFILRF